MRKLENYQHTIYASYLGYVTQAIVNNFAPLLFLTFSREFSLTLDKITLITSLNFAIQLVVDLLSARFIDRIGYRKSVAAAHFFAALGLVGLGVFPSLFPDPYTGILLAVFFYAVGGGLIEVLISPIVEACPTSQKEAAMSLLHSFYCWGEVAVILLTTLFFSLFGIENWRCAACLWAILPAANLFYFLLVPLYPIVAEGKSLPIGKLIRNKTFWWAFVLMICAGASEQAMCQWASTFAEAGLHVSKTLGDLLGPCAFALLMGASRAFYGKNSEKVPLRIMIIGSAALCIVCYLTAAFSSLPVFGLLACAFCGLSVGIFWPGTFSMAAKRMPSGGTAMFALLALAGDLGCSGGPATVGLVAGASGGNLHTGLLAAVIFPVLIVVSMLAGKKE